ncbi:divergent PAP2 family protein [Paenibacillus piri]|uniref:Divergent PAP2 family protein n=1 Tax=Paenibacillus piri TaxID=2547395 RepID=A0A4R5KLX1_9BACL|nr:divergent PAP2 family protein [Paenibacillus piri]TDF96589.1 divergent PAP2 family protein [Paenibacillus piri]
MNRALLTSLATVGLAQFIKAPISQMETGQWKWSTMFKTGGMPSSHSAGVTALTTYVALKRGVSSIPFALAGMFSLVVMYDAMGIRRQAGNIATEVNALEETVDQLVEQHKPAARDKKEERARLEESLGHLPVEVLGGVMLGIATGALSYLLEKPDRPNRLLRLFR